LAEFTAAQKEHLPRWATAYAICWLSQPCSVGVRGVEPEGNNPPESVAACLQKSLDGGVIIALEVQPNSSRDAIICINPWRSRLQVSVKAQAQKGAANRAVKRIIAEHLNINQSAVTIIQGQTSRQKMLRIYGVEVGLVVERLTELLKEVQE